MPTYRFEEVTHRATKRVPCDGCGKTLSRTRTFMQTLNPFNKNIDGTVKTRQDIRDELRTQAAAWTAETTGERHAKCEETSRG